MIVWLASYPRSGNSYLRTVIHTLYGVASVSQYKHPLPTGQAKVSRYPWKRHTNLTMEEMAAAEETIPVKTHDVPQDDHFPAIYVVRDGRASLVSYANLVLTKRGIARPDPRSAEFLDAVRHLMTDERSPFGTWSQNVAAWLARPNTVVIRFEDLIHDTAPVDRAVESLGLGWERLPGVEMPPFELLKAARPISFRRGSSTAWREELSPELHDLFLREHGATMRAAGYQPESENEP